MFDNLGIEWAATLLGCLSAVFVPVPICFLIFGKRLRAKSKFAPTMTPKKPADEESETGSEEDDVHHSMSALHASRSRAHHDLDAGQSLRARTNGTGGTGEDEKRAAPAHGVEGGKTE